MSGKHTNECDANKDPFYIYLNSIFPLTYKLLNSVNWTGTLISPDLIKAVLKQPCKLVNNPLYLYLNAITRIMQDVLD
jgi:hypothetical protein